MNFGDFEPEDAWSPGDEPEELVGNLVARLRLLGMRYRYHGSLDHRLDRLEHKLRKWYDTRSASATERELVRAADIGRHIIVIRERLLNG